MKGRVQMFLLIKKLTLKITAVVATVLLITGATFGIKKCYDNKHKTEAYNPRTPVTEKVGDVNKEQASENSNSIENSEEALNNDILSKGYLPHFELSQLCLARNNILNEEGRNEKVKKIEKLISEKVSKLSVEELKSAKTFGTYEYIIETIDELKLNPKSTSVTHFINTNK